MMIKPIGGMLLVTKKQEEDKTTKSGLVISAVFNDSGPKIGTIVDMGAGEVNYKGEVLINGINIHTQKEKIEGVIGHISQDDLLIEELTVFQNLFYNAKENPKDKANSNEIQIELEFCSLF